jgi:hypothetical protein
VGSNVLSLSVTYFVFVFTQVQSVHPNSGVPLTSKRNKKDCIHVLCSVQANPYMGQLVTQPRGEGDKSGVSTTSSLDKRTRTTK